MNSLIRRSRCLSDLRWLRLQRLKKCSGKDCVRILCNKFGFIVVRQKGSHIVLRSTVDRTVGTVVPNHKELKIGTLKGILSLAKIKESKFAGFQ